MLLFSLLSVISYLLFVTRLATGNSFPVTDFQQLTYCCFLVFNYFFQYVKELYLLVAVYSGSGSCYCYLLCFCYFTKRGE
jgi:hypothetical protein